MARSGTGPGNRGAALPYDVFGEDSRRRETRAGDGTRGGTTAAMGVNRTNLRSPYSLRTDAFFMTLGS
jgi:hypothetical protein